MITLILGNILVGISTFLLTRKFFAKSNSVDFILSWFILFFAQIIIVELLLGIIGQLYLLNLMLSHSLILLIIFLMSRKTETPLFLKPDVSFIFDNKMLLFAIAVFCGFFALKLWINLVNPSTSPDSLQYHLSFPAAWIRNANLNNPIVIFGGKPLSAAMTALTYYPINAELFFLWLMLPIRNAFLADIGQAPFYIIGILAIYAILRKYSIRKDTALFIGLLWALIPNLFKQIKFGSQLDVMCAALFLLVLNNLLMLKKEFNLKNASLFGISLGIFIGTKALNIFWSFALIPLFIYFLYQHSMKKPIKQVILSLVFIFSGLLLFGSFSYLRTFFMTGNPFYPVRLDIFGKVIFPGIIDKKTFSQIFVAWEEFRLKNMFFSEGLGLQFLAFIFPGTIVPIIAIPFIKRKKEQLLENMLLFSVPTLMLVMYLFYIKAYWIRYFFPYLGAGFITAVIFLDRFKWGRIYTTIVGAICILSSAAELAHRNELILSFLISILFFLALLFLRKKILYFLNKRTIFKTLIILIAVASMFLYFLNDRYNNEEFYRYPLLFKGREAGERDIAFSWKWLNENTGSGKRIAYTGRSESYPLFGEHLKNDVLYISVNNKPNLPHYYPDGLYRKEKDFVSWKKNLGTGRIDYLFVALPFPVNNESSNPQDFPIEDKWASQHPESFTLVFSNSKAHIYKVHF